MRRRPLLAWPLLAPAAAARAADAPLRRVGVLAPSTPQREAVTLRPFFEQMARLGWTEGATVAYDRSYADDQYPQLARLARELVARRPELIFAPPLPAAVAARQATSTIPIVFATGTDPVGVGLVQSLAQPGGNATGLISVIDTLAPKSLELLLAMIPGVRRIGLLGDRFDARLEQDRLALAPLLAQRGIALTVAAASRAEDLGAAMTELQSARVDVVMTNSSLTFNLRERLIKGFQGTKVLVAGHRGELAEAGALFSYGAALQEQIRRAAIVVDKILRGARPADIPVEQPTLFEFVLNRRVAAAAGIRVPPDVLLRADRVIE